MSRKSLSLVISWVLAETVAGPGVIEVSPGRGAFCGAFPQEWLIHPVLLLFILQRETLLQVIEVRRILEVKAIALAAERAPPEDLAETF